MDSGGPQAGGIKACSTPVSGQNRHAKEAERPRPSSTTGHHTPAMLSPGSSSSFPRPIYPVPLLSHVPLVRPPPPQLHPGVVQRMIAQGVQPQQLGPALLQTGGDRCLTARCLFFCLFIYFMEMMESSVNVCKNQRSLCLNRTFPPDCGPVSAARSASCSLRPASVSTGHYRTPTYSPQSFWTTHAISSHATTVPTAAET